MKQFEEYIEQDIVESYKVDGERILDEPIVYLDDYRQVQREAFKAGMLGGADYLDSLAGIQSSRQRANELRKCAEALRKAAEE